MLSCPERGGLYCGVVTLREPLSLIFVARFKSDGELMLKKLSR